MINRIQKFLSIVAVLFCVWWLVQLGDFLIDKYIPKQQPIEWIESSAIPSRAKAGETIMLTYQGYRNIYCKASIRDFWLYPNGEKIVFDLEGGYSDLGEFESSFTFTIPEDSYPGIYIYRSRITHRCGNAVFNTQHPHDIIIEVTK